MNTELGFKTNYARTELFGSSFSPRVGRLWNNLPISIRKRESLSMFNNQRLPEQLMDEYPKFTFAPVAKRVFVRNYLYENMMSPVQSFA